MNKPRIIISGGGSGGHIYPALAIADAFKSRYPQGEVLFVGARGRMEMDKVPRAGYAIEGLWISGLQRKLSIKNLSLPFKILSSLWRSRQLLRSFKPAVAVGTGGYASGPLLYMAARQGIPTLIQEQNSYPGITNRWLAGRARSICVAYPGMERYFPKGKLHLTGNPMRGSVTAAPIGVAEARRSFDLSHRPTLLVLGGSQGARRINELISELLPQIKTAGWNLIWQCGQAYAATYLQKHAADLGNQVFLSPFLYDMPGAYAAADLVLSRAGATTISELAAAGKAAILIPSPNVAEDHQTQNARSLVREQAAELFSENQPAAKLLELLEELMSQAPKREAMQQAIQKRAFPEAANAVLNEIDKLLHHGV